MKRTVIDRLRRYAGKSPNQIIITPQWTTKETIKIADYLVELEGSDPRLPPVGWEGYYTRKGGTRWFWCRVVAHDQDKAVVRTKTNNYHAHSPDEFEFSKEPEGQRV